MHSALSSFHDILEKRFFARSHSSPLHPALRRATPTHQFRLLSFVLRLFQFILQLLKLIPIVIVKDRITHKEPFNFFQPLLELLQLLARLITRQVPRNQPFLLPGHSSESSPFSSSALMRFDACRLPQPFFYFAFLQSFQSCLNLCLATNISCHCLCPLPLPLFPGRDSSHFLHLSSLSFSAAMSVEPPHAEFGAL